MSPLLHLALLCASLLHAVDAPATSGERAAPIFISSEWLAGRLNDPSLVLFHIGDKSDYNAGHIPRARHVTLREIAFPRDQGLSLQLPPVALLQSVFAAKGVSDDSRIVLYTGADSVTAATRMFLTLEFVGMGDQTSILDGGLPAWKTEGRPVRLDDAVNPYLQEFKIRGEDALDLLKAGI